MFLPSRSLSKVSAVVQSVAGPVPLTVTADTRNEYSVPRSRPGGDANRSDTKAQVFEKIHTESNRLKQNLKRDTF